MINLLQSDSYGIKGLSMESGNKIVNNSKVAILESQNSLFIHKIRENFYSESNFNDKSLISIESN